MIRVLAIAVIAACSLAACGGGTPAPKDDSEVASNQGESPPAPSAAATSDDSTASPPAASSSATSSSSPPATTKSDSSGEIKTAGGDDPWLASHQMPPKDVMKTMGSAKGKVQACWKAALKNDPSTNGEVKIRFVITNEGKVRVWRDDGSSMSDGDVTQCVGDLLQKLTFPKQKSPGDAWGVYSIHFAP